MEKFVEKTIDQDVWNNSKVYFNPSVIFEVEFIVEDTRNNCGDWEGSETVNIVLDSESLEDIALSNVITDTQCLTKFIIENTLLKSGYISNDETISYRYTTGILKS